MPLGAIRDPAGVEHLPRKWRKRSGRRTRWPPWARWPGGLAHDFNNLLQGVVGALDVVRRRHRPGADGRARLPARRGVDVAEPRRRPDASAARFLAAARPRSGARRRQRGDRLDGGAADECARRSDRARPGADRGACPPTLCDPHQLENAVLNLAINARDAMPHGGRVVIETFCAEPGSERAGQPHGRYVGVRVADTGVGMTPYVAARAFDPFYTTKSPGRGTGLGLAMIRHFVEQFRGSVSVGERCRRRDFGHALPAVPRRARPGLTRRSNTATDGRSDLLRRAARGPRRVCAASRKRPDSACRARMRWCSPMRNRQGS